MLTIEQRRNAGGKSRSSQAGIMTQALADGGFGEARDLAKWHTTQMTHSKINEQIK